MDAGPGAGGGVSDHRGVGGRVWASLPALPGVLDCPAPRRVPGYRGAGEIRGAQSIREQLEIRTGAGYPGAGEIRGVQSTQAARCR